MMPTFVTGQMTAPPIEMENEEEKEVSGKDVQIHDVCNFKCPRDIWVKRTRKQVDKQPI